MTSQTNGAGPAASWSNDEIGLDATPQRTDTYFFGGNAGNFEGRCPELPEGI